MITHIVHANVTSRASDSSVEHESEEGEYPRISAERVERLETLIRLRKLYRNLLRADRLLAQPSPVYQSLGGSRPILSICSPSADLIRNG